MSLPSGMIGRDTRIRSYSVSLITCCIAAASASSVLAGACAADQRDQPDFRVEQQIQRHALLLVAGRDVPDGIGPVVVQQRQHRIRPAARQRALLFPAVVGVKHRKFIRQQLEKGRREFMFAVELIQLRMGSLRFAEPRCRATRSFTLPRSKSITRSPSASALSRRLMSLLMKTTIFPC